MTIGRHLTPFLALASLSYAAAIMPIAPYTPSRINPNVLSGGYLGKTMISADVLPNVWSASSCPTGETVGLAVPIGATNLTPVCECVELAGRGDATAGLGAPLQPGHSTACPPCPARSSRICKNSNCGCECDEGYYATTLLLNEQVVCASTSSCGAPSVLTALLNGQSICNCAKGLMANGIGGCVSP